MTATIHSAQFKTDLVRQAIRTGAKAEALAAMHKLPVNLVRRWLAQAADALPDIFGGDAPPVAAPSRHTARNFRTVFDSSHDAIMLLTEKGFFDCNRSTLSIFGFDGVDDFTRLHPGDLSPPTQPCGRPSLDLANEHIKRAMDSGSDHFEWMHRRRSGEDFEADVLLSCFMEAGRPILQATVRDISRVKRLQRDLVASHFELSQAHAAVEQKNRDLELLCMTDQLTGLYNRRKLDTVIQAESAVARRHREPMSVILADLDHFKRVNDTLGHQGGDIVLRDVASLMRQTVRDGDVVGRWGGEEFMVVCRSTDAAEARRLADRLRQTIQSYAFDRAGRNTCSFGVATFDGSRGVDMMIREADDALYEAKSAGRNRVMVGRTRPPGMAFALAH